MQEVYSVFLVSFCLEPLDIKSAENKMEICIAEQQTYSVNATINVVKKKYFDLISLGIKNPVLIHLYYKGKELPNSKQSLECRKYVLNT